MAIYARLENGTYAEVTGVYKTDGTEITEIFQGDRLVYSASNELYGTVPLYYDGLGYELIDYLISGNAVQDGTPSADAPVDATGSGVRTGNLADLYGVSKRELSLDFATTNNMRIIINGTKDNGANVVSIKAPNIVVPAGTYTVKIKMTNGSITGLTSDGVFFGINRSTYGQRTAPAVTQIGEVGARTFTLSQNTTISSFDITPSYGSVGAIFDNATFECWFYAGSDNKPYEPYGYKLPIACGGETNNIYLGTVPTTRRIKKLVLTGEESWFEYGAENLSRFITYAIANRRRHIAPLCTHYIGSTVTNYSGLSNGYISVNTTPSNNNRPRTTIHDDRFLTVNEFKSYLAAQYAAGTPVTIWYVLAEPETAIVNEPLMKIGDYADTVSFAQAGVTIPTVSGANVLDMTSPVKPSEVYIKGKGIKPTGYGQLKDVNGVKILDKDGRPIYVHGQ